MAFGLGSGFDVTIAFAWIGVVQICVLIWFHFGPALLICSTDVGRQMPNHSNDIAQT